MKLTTIELDFLEKHGIPLDLVFDVQYLKRKEWPITMKEKGKVFAYNAAPCKAEGHTLRTRKGHCIQCNTSKIRYMMRSLSFGIVYIAGSLKGKAIKVGFTENIASREETLTKHNYGGFKDWQILFHGKCEKAGAVESKVLTALNSYSKEAYYDHDNHKQKATEIFSCSFSVAKSTLMEVLNAERVKLLDERDIKYRSKLYEFGE